MVEITKATSEYIHNTYPHIYVAKTKNKYYAPEFAWLLREIRSFEEKRGKESRDA